MERSGEELRVTWNTIGCGGGCRRPQRKRDDRGSRSGAPTRSGWSRSRRRAGEVASRRKHVEKNSHERDALTSAIGLCRYRAVNQSTATTATAQTLPAQALAAPLRPSARGDHGFDVRATPLPSRFARIGSRAVQDVVGQRRTGALDTRAAACPPCAENSWRIHYAGCTHGDAQFLCRIARCQDLARDLRSRLATGSSAISPSVAGRARGVARAGARRRECIGALNDLWSMLTSAGTRRDALVASGKLRRAAQGVRWPAARSARGAPTAAYS